MERAKREYEGGESKAASTGRDEPALARPGQRGCQLGFRNRTRRRAWRGASRARRPHLASLRPPRRCRHTSLAMAHGLLHPAARPLLAAPVARRRAHRARASEGGGKTALSEEVLERLRAAEAEAAALRQELAAARAAREQQVASEESPPAEAQPAVARRVRIDGADLRREGVLLGKGRGSWLNEADNISLTGDSDGATSEAATVQLRKVSSLFCVCTKRRLLLGAVATLALGGFALVPTDYLRLVRPSKPLFLYLVPLLRVRDQLRDVEVMVSEGDWAALEAALQRIQGPPNEANTNLRNAAGSLQSAKERETAELLARNIIEDLDAIDYNKYYAAMGKPGSRGGSQEKLFADFSLRAIHSAEARMRDFFRLMPRDSLAAAEQQISQVGLE